jgi:hypothetical protein
MPRGRGKVVIEVSKELRDRIRELSQKYGVLYESLLTEALNLYTLSNTLSNTQSKGLQSDVVTVPVRVVKEDYMRWTIKVGEGVHAIEVSLNNIQFEKLCKAKLLAQTVCREAGFMK